MRIHTARMTKDKYHDMKGVTHDFEKLPPEN
jgi:hypothetical protein